MNTPTIRAATLDDASVIADLCTQLGYPTSVSQSVARLTAAIQSIDNAVLVACLSGGLIVGWIHVFVARRVESGTFAELGGLVVAEQYRGRGFGKVLLAAAEDWCAEQGVLRLRVRTRSERAGARGFYERLGFSLAKEQHVYDKPLGPNA